MELAASISMLFDEDALEAHMRRLGVTSKTRAKGSAPTVTEAVNIRTLMKLKAKLGKFKDG